MPRVAGLFIYPVKSLRGCAVPVAEIDALGFAGDRRFLIVDDTGKFLTQRTHPRMAQVDARLAVGMLILSAEGAGTLSVSVASDPAAPVHTVSVWKHEGLLAEDCGPDAAAWLSNFLGQSVHLVRIGEKFQRPVAKKAARPGDAFTFADGAPVLVASEASLAALNDRIQENSGEPVPMDRFRPNLVLTDCGAFAEDDFPSLRIGGVTLRNAGKSDRCIMTTTDQLTGERGKEPLKTLATFRRARPEPVEGDPVDSSSVYFGTNYINESKHGTIRVGDSVSIVPA